MESESLSFGRWLRLKRKALDLTRERLADQVGCSAATIRKLEAEERRPSAQMAGRMAQIFKIPPNEQASFLRFARGDWKSAPPGNVNELPWRVTAARTNLPASLTSFIGREQQLKDIHAYLLDNEIRLVSLIGPPGIGKTRLSLETASTLLANFPDGVFFVALAQLEDPSLLLSTILKALGYIEARNLPASQQLMEGIGSKCLLMVLDNCEHLIDHVTPLVSELLSTCPQLKIMTTSRESLRLPGEWIYNVPALAAPDAGLSIEADAATKFPALALFAERARAVQPEFVLNADNVDAVSSICAKLDGLPLAIELIAARIRWMSPQALLERLNDQFILSAEGMRSTSTRQKTLQDAIAWSHNLLSQAEKELFAQLSVFSGGWMLEAAESVWSGGGVEVAELPDLLARLADKSLVLIDQSERGKTRYGMLETIRQYAGQKLLESGNATQVWNRHLEFFLQLAEEANPKLRGPDELIWFERLEREHDNLRAALSWALKSQNAEAGLRLAGKMSYFWFVRGYVMERIGWLEKVLAHCQGGSDSSRAAALRWLGGMLLWSEGGSLERAFLLLEESLALYRQLDDKEGTAWVLNLQGINAMIRGDYKKAEQLYGESLVLRRDLGHPWSIAQTLQNIAPLEIQQGDLLSAKNHAEETLALFQQAGDQRGVARTYTDLGIIARMNGDFERSTTLFTQSLSKLWLVRDRWSAAFVIESLAVLAIAQDTPKRAAQLFGAADGLREMIGLPLLISERKEHDENISVLRKQLEEDIFVNLWTQGASMTLDQAVDFALQES